MKYTKYLRSCGAIVGYKDADAGTQGNALIGFIEGNFDGDLYYITPQGQPELRTVVDSVTLSKDTLLTDGVDTVTLNGLPPDCWLYVGARLVHVTSGAYAASIVGDEALRSIELVGKYRGVFRLANETPTAAAAREDVRWQALSNASPAQIRNWINNNITDLASARQLLITLTLAIRALNDRR